MPVTKEITRLIVGMITGAVLIATGAIHSILGWPAVSMSFRASGAPPALVQGLAVPWHFAGVAMITFGVMAIALFAAAARGRAVSLFPVRVIAAAYMLFGLAGIVLIKADATFLLFLVPGALLLAGAGISDRSGGGSP
jgi:hypothetical protein